AYKIKKAVDLGFVDWRTRESRRNACHREVELNRRFAPDVYQGVAEVRGPDGEVCDWLVVMRRMPADARLAALVRSGVAVEDHLRDVARILAAHHAAARRSARIDRAGTAEALWARWQSNLETLRELSPPADPGTVSAVWTLAEQYVRGRTRLLQGRVAAGLVRDGHGDLLAEDVFCLPDGPRILDCLEFDDDLRALDGVDDAACLAMDLERLGAPALGERFLTWFVEFSGHPCPDSLVHHYVAYRAVMRAKVAALRARQAGGPAADECRQLMGLGLRHLTAAQPTLVAVGGLPGTGKSTLAAALADARGAVLVRSDRLRKELAGLDPAADAAAPWRHGIYSAEWTRRVYDEMARRAAELLTAGESVVLDASWSSERDRRKAREVASTAYAAWRPLRCVAPAEVARQRIRDRRRGVGEPSDASPEIAAAMTPEFDPWEEVTEVNTMASLRESLEHALQVLREPPASGG
ncbi:MAG: AAA family ATPase, partial [Actinomycetes bacterium]